MWGSQISHLTVSPHIDNEHKDIYWVKIITNKQKTGESPNLEVLASVEIRLAWISRLHELLSSGIIGSMCLNCASHTLTEWQISCLLVFKMPIIIAVIEKKHFLKWYRSWECLTVLVLWYMGQYGSILSAFNQGSKQLSMGLQRHSWRRIHPLEFVLRNVTGKAGSFISKAVFHEQFCLSWDILSFCCMPQGSFANQIGSSDSSHHDAALQQNNSRVWLECPSDTCCWQPKSFHWLQQE